MKARSTKKPPLLKRIKASISENLPVGMKEFEVWVNDISLLSGLPVNDKLKQVVATMILQIPPSVSRIPKSYIVSMVRKAAANQVAVEAMSLINEKEKEKDLKSQDPVGAK